MDCGYVQDICDGFDWLIYTGSTSATISASKKNCHAKSPHSDVHDCHMKSSNLIRPLTDWISSVLWTPSVCPQGDVCFLQFLYVDVFT